MSLIFLAHIVGIWWLMSTTLNHCISTLSQMTRFTLLITRRLLMDISPSFLAINKHRRLYHQRSVTTCGTVVRRRRIDNTSPVAALRPVYSDTTQLNSASSRVELRRYKRAFKSTHWGQILAQNRDFCLPHLHLTPPLGGSRWNIAMPFGTEKLEWCVYPMVKNMWC